MNRHATHIATALLSSAITVAAVSYWHQSRTPTTQPNDTRPLAVVATLPAVTPDNARLIQDQQQTITELEQQVAWLQGIMKLLGPNNRQDGGNPNSHPHIDRDNPKPPQQVWFDEQSLLEIGLDGQEVAALKARVDEFEMQKLRLRNQAMREGGARSGELYRALQQLDQHFKDSLNPTEYDQVLYASGLNNRVVVTDTLGNSPANIAGIRAGDVILSYAGEKIYDPSTLYRSTAQGTDGEMVTVKLQRGDETLTVYVPRGPLGTRFKPLRSEPVDNTRD